MQQVVISQQEGIEFPRFEGNGAEAFEGDPDRDGAKLPIRSVDVDTRARTVTVNFDPPVPPGRTLTIALHPVRNPIGGIYLFGVTAVPAGDMAQGQFLGYGRIHIYDNNRGVFWRSPFRRW